MAPLAQTLAEVFDREHSAGVVSTYLFGSHAVGVSHDESDVDVAVLLDYHYTQALRNLASMDLVEADVLETLEQLPGFRNVLVHGYVALDMQRVVEAMDRLTAVEALSEALRKRLAEDG